MGSGLLILAAVATPLWAYPSMTLPFDTAAKAPVLATCVVLETAHDPTPPGRGARVVGAHATLQVLRSFPQIPVSRIHLDYEALPDGNNGDSRHRPRS